MGPAVYVEMVECVRVQSESTGAPAQISTARIRPRLRSDLPVGTRTDFDFRAGVASLRGCLSQAQLGIRRERRCCDAGTGADAGRAGLTGGDAVRHAHGADRHGGDRADRAGAAIDRRLVHHVADGSGVVVRRRQYGLWIRKFLFMSGTRRAVR